MGSLVLMRQILERWARTEASAQWYESVSCARGVRLGGKFKPVALVDKRDGQQQHTENDQADDAISAIELGDVVDKDFHNRDRDENQGLPADERRAAQESDDHQHRAVGHPERGVGEIALDLDAAEFGSIRIRPPIYRRP